MGDSLPSIMELRDDIETSENGSHHVAEKIGQRGPELGSKVNQCGLTANHILSGCGDVGMVQFVGKLNSTSPASQVLTDDNRIDTQENLQSQMALLQGGDANSDDIVSNETDSNLPGDAPRQEPASQSQEHIARTTNDGNFIRWPIEKRNGLLTVLGMIATLFFSVVTNLPAKFLKEANLADKPWSAKDLIAGDFPEVVYLLIFNSCGFMSTMVVFIVLVWPLQFRAILLLLVMCTCVVYIILVSKIVPKFSVRVGKFSVSSIALVWSIVLALIFSAISVLSLWKYTSTLCQFIHWLWKRRTNCCSSSLGVLNA